MKWLRGAFSIGLLCMVAMLGLAVAGVPGAWAQSVNCSATVELEQGPAKSLLNVAHCMLKKRYPYMVGQVGAEVSMTSLQDIRQVSRLQEEAKGDMIGLLLFEMETVDGSKKKMGFNGSTFLVGSGPAGEERIPFAQIKTITISCP